MTPLIASFILTSTAMRDIKALSVPCVAVDYRVLSDSTGVPLHAAPACHSRPTPTPRNPLPESLLMCCYTAPPRVLAILLILSALPACLHVGYISLRKHDPNNDASATSSNSCMPVNERNNVEGKPPAVISDSLLEGSEDEGGIWSPKATQGRGVADGLAAAILMQADVPEFLQGDMWSL